MRVTVTPGWHEQLHRELDPKMGRLADGIAADARRYAPVDTGELKSKIVSYRVGTNTWRVHSRAGHTMWVEYPTRPHLIRARAGGYLRWVDEHGVHYAKQVWHPGTREQPFLRPALFQERAL